MNKDEFKRVECMDCKKLFTVMVGSRRRYCDKCVLIRWKPNKREVE